MSPETEDPRVERARRLGLNHEGIDVRPVEHEDLDFAFARHQEMGYVPSDGSDMGPANEVWITVDKSGNVTREEISPEEAEKRREEASTEPDDDATLEELRARASELEIEGRSSMNKAELAAAIAEAESTQ